MVSEEIETKNKKKYCVRMLEMEIPRFHHVL